MPPQNTLSPEVVRTQLEKILSSAGFARNERLSGLFRFVVEQELCPKPCVPVLLLQGRAGEAHPVLEAQFGGRPSEAGGEQLGRAYALAGRREDAERIAAIQGRPIGEAGIFMALGDKDRAFEALERAIPLGPVRLGRALTYPQFAPLRTDPRFKALRQKVGLPE